MSTRPIAIVLSALLLAGASLAVAEIPAMGTGIGDEVPLSPAELRQISSLVLESNPALSSSPGIKAASAYRSVRSMVLADIIFYPHTDTGGVKQAFQVGCMRLDTETTWNCQPAEVRRYMRVEGQDFEVRVTGDIGSPQALAAIEASRGGLSTYVDSPVEQCRAVMLSTAENGHKVRWDCSGAEGVRFLHVTAIPGADTTKASAWQVSEYLFPEAPDS